MVYTSITTAERHLKDTDGALSCHGPALPDAPHGDAAGDRQPFTA